MQADLIQQVLKHSEIMLDNVIDASLTGTTNSPRAVLVEVGELHEFSRLVRTLGTGRWIFRGHADKIGDWRVALSVNW